MACTGDNHDKPKQVGWNSEEGVSEEDASTQMYRMVYNMFCYACGQYYTTYSDWQVI